MNVSKLDISTAQQFTVWLDHASRRYRRSTKATTRLSDCIVTTAWRGCRNIRNLLEVIPDMSEMVQKRLEKEFHAMRVSFQEDSRHICAVEYEEDAAVRAAVASEGIRKEVLKTLCRWFART